MKYFALSAVAALFFAASVTTNAQVNPVSGEPQAETLPGSDEAVVLPSQSAAGAAAVIDPEEPIIKNVAQKRDRKMGKMVNGYYRMEGFRDWGTNARLNGFGYETIARSASYDDAPIFPAGIAEDEAETENADNAAETDNAAPANDGWDTPAPAAKSTKTTKAKDATPKW